MKNNKVNVQRGLYLFIRSLGGYAILLNLLTLLIVVLTLVGQIGNWLTFSFWLLVATLEFVTRGHVRTMSRLGVSNVLRLKTDWPVLGTGLPVRILGAVLAIVIVDEQDGSLTLWILTIGLSLAVLLETTSSAMVRKSTPSFANTPWQQPLPSQPKLRFYIYLLNNLAIASGILMARHSALVVAVTVLVLLSLVLQSVLIWNSIQRMRAKQSFNRDLGENLQKFKPQFYFYWDAPANTVFQAEMWLPYLGRLDKNFCIILRNTVNFDALVRVTDTPIIVRAAMADLDVLVVPSVKATFYANNAVRNAHFARFLGLVHIQLNHGDSDKPPSYNPVMRMYDRNFVAGQAAIERYSSRGIETAPNFFEIVGRPQIEDITPVRVEGETPQTVVYAPTWAGFMADSALSSLPIGPQMIQELVDRKKRVIFRPHPHARKNQDLAKACLQITSILEKDNLEHDRGHLFGTRAESEMSIVECFNESDAMIADVSSVVPDYLYSGKPFIVVAMGFGSIEGFLEENPVAKASYILEQDASNLDEAFEGLLVNDYLKEVRMAMKSEYLGDFGPERYSQRFVDVASKYLQ